MPEPSLELLQTLMERMLDQQRQVMNRLERVERVLQATLHASTSAREPRWNARSQLSAGGGLGFSGCISRHARPR